jgi:hypothetical protein
VSPRRPGSESRFEADALPCVWTGRGVPPLASVGGRELPAWPGPGTTRLRDACRALREAPAHFDTVVHA